MNKTQSRNARILEIAESTPQFLFSVGEASFLPKMKYSELVFLGASNVGKSSLINAICNRKNLARTSKTPGRTQLINFFSFPPSAIIVDVPGYGFANVPDKVKSEWQSLVMGYLESRSSHNQLSNFSTKQNNSSHSALNLKVYILIDSRRFFKQNDFEVMYILQTLGIDFELIITKIDKLNKKEKEDINERLQSEIKQRYLLTSVKDKIGIEQLLKDIKTGIVREKI